MFRAVPRDGQAGKEELGRVGLVAVSCPRSRYRLLPDSSMGSELVNRLQAGYLQALVAPHSPVIVAGGNPRDGITEAAPMTARPLRRGFPSHRVYQETTAFDTVGNAERSATLLHCLGARDAVVVTSPNHIARTVRGFLTAAVPVAAHSPATDSDPWGWVGNGVRHVGFPDRATPDRHASSTTGSRRNPWSARERSGATFPAMCAFGYRSKKRRTAIAASARASAAPIQKWIPAPKVRWR